MTTIGQILRAKDKRSKTGDNIASLSLAEINRGLRERDKQLGTDNSREAIVLPIGLDKDGNQKYTISYRKRNQPGRNVLTLEQKKAALKEKIRSMKNKESVQ